jgi:hypothetical protein
MPLAAWVALPLASTHENKASASRCLMRRPSFQPYLTRAHRKSTKQYGPRPANFRNKHLYCLNRLYSRTRAVFKR